EATGARRSPGGASRTGATRMTGSAGSTGAAGSSGAASAVNRTGSANAVNRTGSANAVNRTGAANPVVGPAGTARSVGRTGATSAGSGAGRRVQPADEGLRRWLEPSTYGAAGAAVLARALEYRQRRRAALATLTPGRRLWARTRRAGAIGLSLFVVLPAVVFA